VRRLSFDVEAVVADAEPFAEFVLAVSSEANEICEKESKKTMNPDHVVSALKVRTRSVPTPSSCTDSQHCPAQALGFEEFVDGCQDVLKDHKELAKVCCFPSLSFLTLSS
jgi:hypothetical protein